MPYRPRELVVRARESAALLLAALERDEMVARFLDMYAAEHRRPGRADQPTHYREQLERIRRESILAGVLRIEAALPARLKVSVTVRGAKSPRKTAKTTGRHKASKSRTKRTPALELAIPFLDLFREEFFVALGQALSWSDDDAREFWRDLDVYRMLSKRGSGRDARRMASAASGPFVDRVALLLDPSLMEQARRAAGKFELEINGAADRVLRKVFSRRREN
ncbi:MAG TPA: hypothetical protein VEJ38_04630 [Candidatus Acidoferrales bacterium]|nr:hypothetical protein [Candidatus Acidoferrales bacterium]